MKSPYMVVWLNIIESYGAAAQKEMIKMNEKNGESRVWERNYHNIIVRITKYGKKYVHGLTGYRCLCSSTFLYVYLYVSLCMCACVSVRACVWPCVPACKV